MDDSSSAKKPERELAKRRRFTRFSAVPQTMACIWDWTSAPVDDAATTPFVAGLVIDESYAGCSLVVVAAEKFKPGYHCILKYGEFEPTEADVVWVRELEPGISRIGVSLRLK